MTAKKPYKHYETITVLVKYFADGVIHYCHPQTGELLFEKKTPNGQSPVVELEIREPLVKYTPEYFEAVKDTTPKEKQQEETTK